jgi:peptidoglycan/LPS O-acetylase OafA/YrhL
MSTNSGSLYGARARHLDALTSLRFFAAAMIVIGHAHGLFGSFGLALNFSLTQGVSFFFVLSGFILTYNYKDVEKRLWKFYRARFARLWPMHVVAILLVPLVAHTWNIDGLSSHKAAAVVAANLLLVQSWIPAREFYLALNGVAWSISTEAFFYVAFPVALLFMRRSAVIVVGATALITVAFMWIVMHFGVTTDESAPGINAMGLLYVNPLARLFEFVLGMAACKVYLRLQSVPHTGTTEGRTVDEIIVLALIVISMHLTPRLPLWQVLPPDWVRVVQYYAEKSGSAPIFAISIVVFALGRGLVSRALTSRVMVFLGEASYALYLTHATVLMWFEAHPAVASLEVAPYLFWAASLLLASLLFVFVETPLRRLIIGIRPSVKPVEA